MATKKRSNTSLTHGTSGNKIVHQEQIDDELLPDSHELKRYSEINPDVVTFIMERTQVEQDHRHKIRALQSAEAAKNNLRGYRVTMHGMYIGGIIIVVVLFFAYNLIMAGHHIVGGIFGGTSVLSAIILFVNKGKSHTQ